MKGLKLAVVAEPETARGFRLAGFEAHPAHSPEEAKARLEALIASGAYALIAVDQGLLPDPERAVERLMRGRDLPVLLPVPGLQGAFAGGDVEAYMRNLVRETLGFDIKL